MIKVYIPKTVKGSETRYGDSQIIYDPNTKSCIVIDGGCGNVKNATLAYLKAQELKHLTLVVTHWHADHYEGARAILDAAYTIVDEVICNNPEEVAKSKISKGELGAGRSFVSRVKALGKTLTYLPSKTVISKSVGSIKMKLWRVAYYTVSSDQYASVNNTSIAVYFPDFYYLTSGDMGDDTKTMLNAFNATVKVFKIPHHGNACNQSTTQAFINHGAKICWYNDLGNVNTSGFLAYGARRCKQAGLITLNTDQEIVMSADNGKLRVAKAGKTYTYEVPMKETKGWIKDSVGWWYKKEDGTYPKSQWMHLDKWYYFNEKGYAVTGWNKINWRGADHWFYFGQDCRMKTGWQKSKDDWYYLDPTSGVMLTGWIKYDNRVFYLEPNAANNMGHSYTSCTAEIDGKAYQFDANGVATELLEAKEYEPSEDDTYAVKVKDLSTLNGIDIASYQAALDIRKLGDDTNFVIVKATQGTYYVNPCCNKHMAQALESKKLRGTYHYAGGGDPVKEAQYYYNNIKGYIGKCVCALDYEREDNKNYHKGDVEWCLAFIKEFHRLSGVWCLLYISMSDTRYNNWTEVAKLSGLWVAQYANNNSTGYKASPWRDKYGTGAFEQIAIHQYTSNLKLPGYSGRLDGNIAYMSSEAWLKYANSNA